MRILFNYSKNINFHISAPDIRIPTVEKGKTAENVNLEKAKKLYDKNNKKIQQLQSKIAKVDNKLETLDFNKFVKELIKKGVNLDSPQALTSLAFASTPHMALMLRYKIIGDDARGRIDRKQIKVAPSKAVAMLASQNYSKPSVKAEIYKLCFQRATLQSGGDPEVGIALFKNKDVPKNLKLKLVEKSENQKFLKVVMLKGYENNDYTYLNKISGIEKYNAMKIMSVEECRFIASATKRENVNETGVPLYIMDNQRDTIARINLINNKHYSVLDLSWEVKDDDPKVKKAMMDRVTKELMSSTFESYPLLDLRIQTALLESKDAKVRTKLAGYRDIDRKIVKKLVYDPSSQVKLALIKNNSTWEAELKILSREDKDKKIREAASLQLAKNAGERGGA